MGNQNELILRITKYVAFLGFLLLCMLWLQASAQQTEVIGKPEGTKLAVIKFPAPSETIFSGEGVPLGISVRTAKGMTVIFSDGREFLFDRYGEVVASEQAKSFVILYPQKGEFVVDWDLAFYSPEAELLAMYEKRHGYSKVVVSQTGTVAIAGAISKSGERGRIPEKYMGIVIYDPKGKEISRQYFPENPIISALAISPSGKLMAAGFEKTVEKSQKQWSVRIQDYSGQIIRSFNLPKVIQGLRIMPDENTLLISVSGGVYVVHLDKDVKLEKPVRLPSGFYIVSPGRIFFKSGKLIAVAEKPSKMQRGTSMWSLFLADMEEMEFKMVEEGETVKSRGSPGLSMSKEFGAEEWPSLVTPKSFKRLSIKNK